MAKDHTYGFHIDSFFEHICTYILTGHFSVICYLSNISESFTNVFSVKFWCLCHHCHCQSLFCFPNVLSWDTWLKTKILSLFSLLFYIFHCIVCDYGFYIFIQKNKTCVSVSLLLVLWQLSLFALTASCVVKTSTSQAHALTLARTHTHSHHIMNTQALVLIFLNWGLLPQMCPCRVNTYGHHNQGPMYFPSLQVFLSLAF